MLYESITGRVPYRAAHAGGAERGAPRGVVPPPSSLVAGVGDRLDAVLLQSLRRDPDQRFRSAVAMLRALELSGAEATDDTTRVVRVPSRPAAPPARPAAGGYVPPSVPDSPPAASTRAAGTPPPCRGPGPSDRRAGGAACSVSSGPPLILGAAALVVLLVVLPLLDRRAAG